MNPPVTAWAALDVFTLPVAGRLEQADATGWMASYALSMATTAPGLGASHQTGWTALVADLIRRRGSRR